MWALKRQSKRCRVPFISAAHRQAAQTVFLSSALFLLAGVPVLARRLPLKALIHTNDPDKGYGATNRGRHSSAEIDAVIQEALATVDDAKRQDLLAKATEMAMENVAIIPTHFQVNTWGAKKGLRYIPRTDEYTLAIGVVKE